MSARQIISRRILVFAALLGASFAVGMAASGLAEDSEIGEGATTIHISDAEPLPAVGRDGLPIVCPDGETLYVGPTNEPPPEIAEPDGAVPRCGPEGGGKTAPSIWVPESEADASAVVAPQEYVEAQAGNAVADGSGVEGQTDE